MPSHPIPKVVCRFLPIAELQEALGGASDRLEHAGIQATVARSGEMLLLVFDQEEGWRR